MKKQSKFKTIPIDQPFDYTEEERKGRREEKRGWQTKFCPEWALPHKSKVEKNKN